MSLIPDENLKHIFKRFYKAANSELIVQRGAGIGLSLIKDFTFKNKVNDTTAAD